LSRLNNAELKSLDSVRLFIEISFLCLPRLHLFDKKKYSSNSHIVKYNIFLNAFLFPARAKLIYWFIDLFCSHYCSVHLMIILLLK